MGETGRRFGDRFREHIHSTRPPDSDLTVGRHLLSRVTQLGHAGFCHPFGFQGCQKQTQL